MGFITISAPSGCGKNTIIEKVMARMQNIGLSISCTTRQPRDKDDGSKEQDGVDYFFLEEDKYHKMREENQLLEYTHKRSGWYGTPRAYVDKLISQGKEIILFNIDMQGAVQLKAIDPGTVTIYLLPPSLEELDRRLAERGTETPAQREKRMQDNKGELKQAYACDYVVVNDQVEDAVEKVIHIIAASRCRMHLHKDKLDRLNMAFDGM